MISPDTLSVVVRALSFVLLFQATGAVLFAALFKPHVTVSALAIQRLTCWVASMGVMLVLVHLALEATRMIGEFAGLMDVSMQQKVWTSSIAAAHAMQIMGLLLISLNVTRHHERAAVSVIGAVCAVSGFLLTGHTSVHPWRMVLAPLLAIHLLIVAFWFGSLLPLWLVVKHEALSTAKVVLQRFSQLATWLVPLIAIAGLMMTLLIANGIPPVNEPYGQLIIAKLSGFTALIVLAAFNKWRLVPAIEPDATRSVTALRRSMTLEWMLIVAVLSTTAVMTTFYSPNE